LVPGALQSGVLATIQPILVADAQVKSQGEATAALSTLYDTSYAFAALKK
jgi:sulfonate transport system substrate-binding protein